MANQGGNTVILAVLVCMHEDGFFFCEVNTMADIIQIEELCKTFGSGESAVAALNDVSLQVKEGEDAAGTDAETETAPFDRASKI